MSNASMRARPTVLFPVEHRVTYWHHTVPAETTPDDLLNPEFWTHVATNLRPHSRIMVDREDGAWTATLFVRSATRLSAVVAVEHFVEFGGRQAHPSEPGADDYEIGWGGPAHKHRVIRKSDRQVMEKGFETPEAAAKWLKDYILTLATAA